MSSHNKTESEILKTFIKSEACEANLQSIQDPHLFKHFDIKRQLGSGGSGAVFLAYDYQLQRDVAIKVLAPGNSFANR